MSEQEVAPPESASDPDVLALVLESIANENAVSRVLVSQLLLEKFNRARHASTKRICAVEIFCKLMETIEDFGAFCLMWTKTPKGGDPLKTYLAVNTQQIIEFYASCLKGLPEGELLRILPMEPPNVLEQARFFFSADELEAYRALFAKEVEGWANNLTMSARLFSRIEEKSGKARHADALNMFLNAKHGRKVLHPKGKVAKKLGLKDEEIAIIAPNPDKRAIADGAQRHWITLRVRLEPALIQKMYRDTATIAQQLEQLARMQFNLVEDPKSVRDSLKSQLSTIVAMNKKTLPPESACPCENGKAFKDCHGR